MADRPVPSIEVDTPHGPVPLVVSTPDSPGPWPGVVVIHDAAGMTNDLVNQTRWLADAGFVAVAPDLLRGGTIARCLRDIVRDFASWEGTVYEQIDAVREWTADRSDCAGRVGVIGFCLGGGFALGLAPGHGFSAASANYGRLPKDADRFFVGACPIIGSYGGRDRSLRGAADQLSRSLDAAGVVNDVKEYPDVGHSFMNDPAPGEMPMIFQMVGPLMRAGFDEASTLDARARIVEFFGRHLAEPSQDEPAAG